MLQDLEFDSEDHVLFVSVMTKMRGKKSTIVVSNFHQYLIVLAMVDIFLILMFVVDDVILGQLKSGEWFFTVIPYITHPVKCISITMTVVWVVIIAMKRFLVVTKPLKNHINENIFISSIFMICFSITVNLSK